MFYVELIVLQQDQLLKHLPDASVLLLLNTVNTIWISGDCPSDWRNAIVIPSIKSGKDPTNPTSCRPIAYVKPWNE